MKVILRCGFKSAQAKGRSLKEVLGFLIYINFKLSTFLGVRLLMTVELEEFEHELRKKKK